MNKKLLNYSDYLKLEEILNNQKLISAKHGAPAHDEMLFIIIHQIYELWFKQIIHELDSILVMFGKISISESDVSLAVTRLDRIIEIQKINEIYKKSMKQYFQNQFFTKKHFFFYNF